MNKKTILLIAFSLLTLSSCGNDASSSSSSSLSSASAEQETTMESSREDPDITVESLSISSPEELSSSEEEAVSETSEENDPIPDEFKDGHVYEEELSPLPYFAPTRFIGESLSIDGEDHLSDGVDLYHYSFLLNSGNKVKAEVVEINPRIATIRSNYKLAHEPVYNSIQNYQQKHDDIKVLAGINADFFGTSSVNAYVQDGVIIKASHNDNGIYDYTNLNADIPASMPMLFGIGGDHVRIAPIVEGQNVENTIKSSFFLKLRYAHADKQVHEIDRSFSRDVAVATNALTTDYTLIDHEVPGGVATEEGDSYYLLEAFEDNGAVRCYQVVDEYEAGRGRTMTADTADGYIYLFKKASVDREIEIGDTVSDCISSEDGKWDNYQTIIGGRQSLVENGEIAPTVTLENSNGAQNTGVPRSCVGITPDHKVLLVGIEGLRYGRKSTSDDDPYGVSLPELAEFMRAIGSYDAMNFDGGGSTQLFARSSDDEEFDMLVRSSDYGTYVPTQGRPVYNTFLVAEKL